MDLDKDTQPKVVELDKKRQREERLKHLQKLIDSGQYSVSAEKIAEAWLQQEPIDELSAMDIDKNQSEKNSKTEE